jgi:hypothetical protein
MTLITMLRDQIEMLINEGILEEEESIVLLYVKGRRATHNVIQVALTLYAKKYDVGRKKEGTEQIPPVHAYSPFR